MLFSFHQLHELHVNEHTSVYITGIAYGLDLNASRLSFCAAIFDSIVRVSKNMINPMGHLIM